jgi:hypothetical protein
VGVGKRFSCPLATFPSAVALTCRKETDDAQSDFWWNGGGRFTAHDGGDSEHGPGGLVPFVNVSKSGSVTFSIAPGDSFFVVSQMFARADSREGVPATVDALNTLALHFTAGNTSLLTPGLPSNGPGPGTPEDGRRA